MTKTKNAKQAVLKMLKNDAAEGNITPVEHQMRWDKLKAMEDGHDILYYLNGLGVEV